MIIQNSSKDSFPGVDPLDRFLSRERCAELTKRITSFSVGGGTTTAFISSVWYGNLRWARNQVTTSGDIQNTEVTVQRSIRGAVGESQFNQLTDAEMDATVRRAERIGMFSREVVGAELPKEPTPQNHATPSIWSDATYGLSAEARAETMRALVQPAEKAGMLAAGYIEVSAHGRAVMSNDGTMMYYPYTKAQYSVTVRDPDGTGSGWAGVDWHDWNLIDAPKLSAIALDKCLRSRNPVRIEPGRYTAILEPQATYDLIRVAFYPDVIDRNWAESEAEPTVYSYGNRNSKIGLQIYDRRITVTQDCMDPELGFPPFSERGELYNPISWIRDGVVHQLAHDRDYAIKKLNVPTGYPASGAYRMSGGTTTVDEMISSTKRGLLVTRFSQIQLIDRQSLLCTGYTRDGLWLIENGAITKAVNNFRFTESPAFILNNVEQLGVPQRVFAPGTPAVVPAMKVRDFSFTSLSDAV